MFLNILDKPIVLALTNVNRYWVMGNCLAGDGCPFSHDPSALIGNLSVTDGSRPASPSLFQVDSGSDAFPPLQAADNGDQWANQYTGRYPAHLLSLIHI